MRLKNVWSISDLSHKFNGRPNRVGSLMANFYCVSNLLSAIVAKIPLDGDISVGVDSVGTSTQAVQ